MRKAGLRRLWRCAWLAPVILLALFFGCPPPALRLGQVPDLLVNAEGVPIIRVLVGSGAVLRTGTNGAYRVSLEGREVAGGSDPLPLSEVAFSDGAFRLGGRTFHGRRLSLESLGRSAVTVGSTVYRGKIVFYAEGGSLLAVNHVDVEGYLAGVICREVYAHWQTETFRAQCIAARTYALYEQAVAGAGRLYDVQDDQSSQVYGGLSAETERSRQAVRDTRGLVLAAGPAGQEKIFKAYFSAVCGGRTNSAYVLAGPASGLSLSGPLAGGVVCTDCQRAPRYRWPTVTVSKNAIYQAAARYYPQAGGLGGVKAVEVVEEANGRPIWLDLVGPGDQKVRLRADDLRLCLLREGQGRELYSMNCRIVDAGKNISFTDGRGWGHGVGLCQWGAEGKALRGCSCEEILAAYYPGAKLIRAY